ncbi:uncharacterized protein OCT59_000192 [Rhizophagus irregularis]|uniref:uncharacterized protein n=1 Tax=Rhizophagus irregularis TaxID=588596 RepID=UPI003324832F|nr:hypothetical protein OCT59_000192 [Rhizophagus irregularis]
MEEFKLSDDVIEQIKDFDYWDLTNEQKLLVDKLILNEELKKRFKGYGLCKECKQPNTGGDWSKRYEEILEWIEYDRFENVEYLAEGGFGTIHKAIWKDGYIVKWNSENNQWKREENWLQHKNFPVVLKCLHNSVTSKFLREIESHTMVISSWVTRCFGITKGPDSNKFMMVIEYAKEGSLRQYLNNIFNLINWEEKLEILQKIAGGLDSIHEKGLIHRDFHSGNMLKDKDN